MIVSSRYGLRIVDVYFDEPVPSLTADLVRYHYWSQEVHGPRTSSSLTATIDLRNEPAVLLAAMTKSTRYDIRRAEREGGYSFRAYRDDGLPLREFVPFFNAFADIKGTVRANERHLSSLACHKLLTLTRLAEPDGSPLVWHAYIQAGAHARLLYSGSVHVHATEAARRQFLARANRYHHWRDMLLFRDSGVSCLDFGGICESSCEDLALTGIRDFKTGFGGAIIRMFDSTEAVSARGRAAIWLRDRIVRPNHPARIEERGGANARGTPAA